MRNGQQLLRAWVPDELAERFKDVARQQAGGASAMLRRLIAEALGKTSAVAPRGAGQGRQIAIRLKPPERAALALEAHRRGTTPTNWVRALVLARLSRRPQWTGEEIEALRQLYGELSRIGNNVNQIARATNAAVQGGVHPPEQGALVRAAAERISAEMDRIADLVAHNGRYWDENYDPNADAKGQESRRLRTTLRRRRPDRFSD